MKDKPFFSGHWMERKKAIQAAMDDGRVIITLEKAGLASRLVVVCPFDTDFTKGAREIGGKWRHRTNRWTFDPASARLVKALAERVYGRSKVESAV